MQDQHKLSENEHMTKDHVKRIDSERASIAEFEQSLDEAEKTLEIIRDSLKGTWCL